MRRLAAVVELRIAGEMRGGALDHELHGDAARRRACVQAGADVTEPPLIE